MASRIFWIFLVVAALIAGALFQGRDLIFAWTADTSGETRAGRAIETRVAEAVESSIDRMQVVDSDGRAIDVAPQTRRDLADAVRRLASAEAEIAIMRVSGSDDAAALREARTRRDAAKADVERLKTDIERQDELSGTDRDAVRQQIQQEVRSSIRETVRSAVRG